MISPVSSTESVVCVMYASFASGGKSSASASVDRLDQDRRLGRLAHRPLDLLVAGVPDQDHRVALGRVAPGLDVHLGHERAGRVDRVQPARGRVRVHRRSHAVGGEDDRRSGRRLLLALDEHRTAFLELADDVRVVDDLLADVHRRAVVGERQLHRVDGAFDAGAVAARRGQEHSLDHGSIVARRPVLDQ